MRALFGNRHVLRGTLAVGVLAGLFGVNATLNGNQPVPLPDGVVIFGAEEVTVQKDVNILSGDLASNGEVELDRDVFVEGSVIGDEVEIERGVRILGNLEANEIEAEDDDEDENGNNSFIVEGETIIPRQTPDFFIPELPPVNPGTQDLRIKKGDEVTIQPGAYRDIRIEDNANVTLQIGDYHLRSLTIGNNVVFAFAGPTTLNVQQRVSFGNKTIFNLPADLDSNQIKINFHGQNLTVGNNAFAAGVIHAPNALVFIHKESVWRGQVAAKRVGIGKDVIVAREAAFATQPNSDVLVADPDGGVYPINTILVLLAPDATFQDAVAAAQVVGGQVVGVAPATNLYQIDVPAASIAELEVMMAQLRGRTDLKIEGVFRNYLFPADI